MPIDLKRTFSSIHGPSDDSGEDWSRYFDPGSGKLGWDELHEKAVAVVVGEAGIGKTFEFKNECHRMQSDGTPSFFIALNQLVDSESWIRALVDHETEYEHWLSSSDIGYFFLDAVDEARLKGQADFENALVVVRRELRPHLARVRIALSSRWTDWTIEGVRACVANQLVRPIEKALRVAQLTPEPDLGSEGSPTFSQPSAVEQLEPYVVSLEPLSKVEASRFADALGVADASAFWSAVSDGSYEFMATRPLDLRWMVELWNARHSLGTYLELIEVNIANRLTDVNLSYQAAGAVLSPDQLRLGAEELAAAAEFSSRPFVSTEATVTANSDEVPPQTMLPDWKTDEISRLLASAIFDEATYGRVKFHHRSIREYLAACWVKRQLANGVPFQRVLRLFSAAPFGATVLIPNRRASLCWLAAIDVVAREWVTRYFPEMLLFEGDPEAWDELSADQAFMAYVQRRQMGLRTEWSNDASEFRRVGRRLPPGRIAGLLADATLSSDVKISLLPVVKHSRLTDCADVIFGIYKDTTTSPRERRYSLEVLETIARPEQREAIKQDLLASALDSNELVASALEAIDWPSLGVDQLAKLFLNSKEEERYDNGALTRVVKYELLRTATAGTAEMLLIAVLQALPRPEAGKRFARFPETDRPERAWLLDVLPDCFERLLALLPTDLSAYPESCLEAAERIEALRISGFTDHDEFKRLHNLIAQHTVLRWQIGLEIAQSEDLTHATSRLLIWGTECLISFVAADMPELISRAADSTSTAEVRDIWFTVGMELAFLGMRGKARTDALTALTASTERESRAARIGATRAQRIQGATRRRGWAVEERRRKQEGRAKHEASRVKFQASIANIRDATHKGTLQWLMHYSYKRSGNKSITRVDYSVIEAAFGKDIAAALDSGLKAVWSTAQVPNPADYQNGEIPWEALAALAGLQTMLDEGVTISAMTAPDAARAAQLAVWEPNAPPLWFEDLIQAQGAVVCEALHPWIVSEAQVKTDIHRFRGALALSLNCPPAIRVPLLQPLLPLVVGGLIGHPQTLKTVVDALREDGQIAPSLAADVCRGKVFESIGPDGLIAEIQWLRMWLEEDMANAWAWFEEHVAGLAAKAGEQVKEFARAAADCKWVKLPADSATVDVLLRLYDLLTQHLPAPGTPAEDEDAGSFGHPISQLRESIPGVLVKSRGVEAHRTLVRLADAEIVPHVKSWLLARVQEHAALAALQFANVEPSDLSLIGSPFRTEPRTEAQLFEQVVARLEEIRTRVEEGPFSDRDLFTPDIPEKHLQRWLAARFRDTPNRRFSIHREEEVDDDKKTDIQLSGKVGNVCVEIKPVNERRGYSANTLTKTLRDQIVGQYLKGENSQHGILVLFRLDTKTWNIPGELTGQPFGALVEYLQAQANIIKNESKGVQALLVFGIDCVA